MLERHGQTGKHVWIRENRVWHGRCSLPAPVAAIQSKLPPFSAVIKGRAVEDPVNLWVHRPIAYAFVALIYRTRITPNQVTLIALAVGLSSALCFVRGTAGAMLAGGVLLWSSAILDGADGILARAKRVHNDAGRAIDGIADAIVAAATVFAVFYHLWITSHDLTQVVLMPFALVTAVIHVYSYDYYKESFLFRTRGDWDGHPERPSDIAARLQRLLLEKASWIDVEATKIYAKQQEAEARVVAWTNPLALRAHLTFPVNAESVSIYTRLNAIPMKLWAANSLAPHSYVMAVCAMFDRLDVYLYIRVVLANLMFVATLILQRRATRKTENAMREAGLAARPAN